MLGGQFCQYSKCSHFSNIIFLFEGFFAYNKYNVLVDSFLICFRQFYFLTQSYDFAKAIGFALRPFCQYSNWCHFSNIRCFFARFFGYDDYNLVVESFLRCFRQFYFLPQSQDVA